MAALAAHGHSVRIVTYPSGRDVEGLRTVRPLARAMPAGRAMPVGSSRRKLLLDAVLAPAALAASLRFPGGRPHLIHAYLHEGALIGALLARLLHVPLVFDFQGSLAAEMLDHRFIAAGSPLLPALRRLENWIDRQPQAILPSSAHAARLLAERHGAPARRIHTLHDSVDPAAFRPRAEFPAAALHELRQRLGLPAGRPALVYLGLLAPYQGTELLLEALTHLRQPPPYTLVMGFPHVARYRQLAADLGLAEHVAFSGAVPYEQAPLHLALGDVAVAPKLSASEGSGKLLTYMAAGLPVAAFDTPVHREYLGELGYYARPGDAASLASAIEQALQDPATAGQRGQWLRQRVLERYTWQRAAEQIEAVYRSLLSAGQR